MAITDQDYLKDRLDNQQQWLEDKAAWNQRWYKRLRMIEIVAAALIPALIAFGMKDPYSGAVSAALGILIAISAGAMGLFKFHENWVQYRGTAEQLKHEHFMYETQTGPYAGADRYGALVERVESILMKENAAWSKTFASKEARNDNPPAPAAATSAP